MSMPTTDEAIVELAQRGMLTIIRCCGYEARMDALLETQCAEEQAGRDFSLDMPDRLAGDCERCQEPQPDLLTIVGGEGCCDDCIAAERAANDDPRDDDVPHGPECDVPF